MQAVTITHSPLGKKLKKPIELSLPETTSAADQRLQQYVITSLSARMPALVILAFDNTSVLELAKHLYVTGQQAHKHSINIFMASTVSANGQTSHQTNLSKLAKTKTATQTPKP